MRSKIRRIIHFTPLIAFRCVLHRSRKVQPFRQVPARCQGRCLLCTAEHPSRRTSSFLPTGTRTPISSPRLVSPRSCLFWACVRLVSWPTRSETSTLLRRKRLPKAQRTQPILFSKLRIYLANRFAKFLPDVKVGVFYGGTPMASSMMERTCQIPPPASSPSSTFLFSSSTTAAN